MARVYERHLAVSCPPGVPRCTALWRSCVTSHAYAAEGLCRFSSSAPSPATWLVFQRTSSPSVSQTGIVSRTLRRPSRAYSACRSPRARRCRLPCERVSESGLPRTKSSPGRRCRRLLHFGVRHAGRSSATARARSAVPRHSKSRRGASTSAPLGANANSSMMRARLCGRSVYRSMSRSPERIAAFQCSASRTTTSSASRRSGCSTSAPCARSAAARSTSAHADKRYSCQRI